MFIKKMLTVIVTTSVAVGCALPNTALSEAGAADVAAITDETLDFYDYWKDKYVVQNPYTSETQYYVFYGDQTYAQAGYEVPVTVSEAHGYGMLIAASMAEYDSEAKEIFDGMYNYYKAHLSEIGPNLMAWQQSDNGAKMTASKSNSRLNSRLSSIKRRRLVKR